MLKFFDTFFQAIFKESFVSFYLREKFLNKLIDERIYMFQMLHQHILHVSNIWNKDSYLYFIFSFFLLCLNICNQTQTHMYARHSFIIKQLSTIFSFHTIARADREISRFTACDRLLANRTHKPGRKSGSSSRFPTDCFAYIIVRI